MKQIFIATSLLIISSTAWAEVTSGQIREAGYQGSHTMAHNAGPEGGMQRHCELGASGIMILDRKAKEKCATMKPMKKMPMKPMPTKELSGHGDHATH
ncbi:MAG: hypothetical protein OEZ58_06085 [Gammaproteobacteria bacterium]|nr:hypothetical protein [Gammaproteobacteria bacterium]MDH5728538.1 hypothetical protein [Gammaproteobacteria bacterium]